MTDKEALYSDLARMLGSYGGDRRFSCWVMDRASYDRIRAMAMTEEQETARALAHATAWIPILAQAPYLCPACPDGPFADMAGLTAHVAAMADPANREPLDGDMLFGIPIEVREDGGVPHIEDRTPRG